MAHGLSCSRACGILLDQGLNPCLLHWKQSPYHWATGSPLAEIYQNQGHGEQPPPHLFQDAPFPILPSSPPPGGACISHSKVKVTSTFFFFFFGADLAGGRIPKNSAQQSWWQSCRRLGSFLFPEGQLTSPPQLGENIEPFTATQGQPFSPRDNQEFTGTRFSFFSHRSDRFIRLWLKKERFCWIWIHQTELQRHEEVEIGLRSSGTQKGWCVSRYGLNHEFVQEVQD